MMSFGFYRRALRVIKPTEEGAALVRNSTAGMVTVTKLVVVNISKGLFLPSDLRASSHTWDLMGG